MMFLVTSEIDYNLEEQLVPNGKLYTLTLLPKEKTYVNNISLTMDYSFNSNNYIFANGYQSWTESKEYMINEKMRSLDSLPNILNKRYSFPMYGDSFFYKYPNRKGMFHGYTYGYVREDRKYFLIASLNDDEVYTIINFDCRNNKINITPDLDIYIEKDFVALKFLVLEGNEDVFSQYKSYFPPLRDLKKLHGYTSWYNHYQNINESIILDNIEAAKKGQFELFQIDDGFESYVGDFLEIDSTKFPNGLKGIVQKIHDGNMLAGIWLAPFVAEKKSKLVVEHPEYIATDDAGNFIVAGCGWSGYYALDVEKEEVKEYVRNMFKFYIDELGFDLVKLDFLYAACLKKRTDKTRAKVMRDAMKLLRECCGEKLILGCGVPLASSFNLVDYCRIGCDISLIFDDVWFMKYMHRERISTKMSLQDTIYRRHLDGLGFLNDPDVFLLRDENMKMSKEQKYALGLINHLFGSVYLTSDNINNYDEEKMKLLKEFRSYENAKVTSVYRNNDNIEIDYQLDGQNHHLTYNANKGIII